MLPFFYKKGKRKKKKEKGRKEGKEKRKKGKRREGQKEEGAPDIYNLPRTVSSARLEEMSSIQALT